MGLLLLLGAGSPIIASDKVRSAWSAGVKWGSGTPTGARTDAYWLPDGRMPTSGRPFPDVAIAGLLLTTSLQSATWTLGIPDILADLSPNTASLTFVGQVSGVPADDVVISTGLGVLWAGRLDTVTQTRDTAGDWWTTVTATDRIGALGRAELDEYELVPGTVEWVAESTADAAGVTLDVVDDSTGLPALVSYADDPYTGSVLSYINLAAKSSNAMLAMTRDGRVSAVMREAVTPSTVLDLADDNAPQTWSLITSIDVDINKWLLPAPGPLSRSDAADVLLYGERVFDPNDFVTLPAVELVFLDWYNYGGSQRPTASGTLIVSDYSQDKLILLDPFQWVTESGTSWQVLSVQHSVSASPYSWTVSITADNLLSLL